MMNRNHFNGMLADELFDSRIENALKEFESGRDFSKCFVKFFDDEPFFNYVLNKAQNILRSNDCYRSNGQKNREIVLFAIGFIAVRKYSSDGNKEIWPYIRESFPVFTWTTQNNMAMEYFVIF